MLGMEMRGSEIHFLMRRQLPCQSGGGGAVSGPETRINHQNTTGTHYDANVGEADYRPDMFRNPGDLVSDHHTGSLRISASDGQKT
jgi:hypothetical protein